MRLLFDARSVRTPSGRYILQGLTAAWRADRRVSHVVAAIRGDFNLQAVPEGVETIRLHGGSWATHLLSELPRVADQCGADVIFCPNGLAPRDSRAVLYYQDMFHFRVDGGAPSPAQEWLKNRARDSWRQLSIGSCKLAISVSREISTEVSRRVSIPSVVIPNGVDVDDLSWTGDLDRVFVLGGLGPRKDEQTAIRAWARIPATKRQRTQLHIGGVEPTARRQRLNELTARLGIAAETCIMGTMPRVAYLEAIARSRLAIACSRQEAFGLPVAEAIAIGAPLLCTNIPSHLELLERASVGASFGPHDAAGLAVRIEAALDGALPPRLTSRPSGWSWIDRAREHVDAYSRYV